VEERVKGPRNPLLAVIFVIAFSALGFSSAANVYITPNGTSQGACTTNPQPPAWFNSPSNWGNASSQIGPGTVVHLCGTFTFVSGATGLNAQGSGSAGSPVTVLFEAGTIVQAPDFGSGGAAIRLDGASYITLDGGGTGNAGAGSFVPNGIIQATLSGTSGGACIGGPCTQNNGGTGVSATNTNNIVIKNLLIRDMYLRTSFSDQSVDWSSYFCIHASPSSTLTIDNNSMTDSGEIIAINGNGNIISNNDISNTNHGISLGAGSTNWTGTYIFGNHIHDMAAWDAGSPYPYHHDGIHIFPGSPGFYQGVYIYNNTFDGDIGASAPTAWIYAEKTCCTGGTNWVFNNYATTVPYRSSPAVFGIYSGSSINFVNNTVVGNGYSGGGVGCDLGYSDSKVFMSQNNICGAQSYGWNVQNGTTINGTGAMDYNSYIDGSGGGNGDNLAYAGTDTQSLSTWKNVAIPGAATHDGHSQLATLAAYKLNSDGSLQSGSPAIGAGNNLFGTCNGQPNPGLGALCSDKVGNPRPTSGAWDAGAYNAGGQSGQPNPPTGLSAIVN
jgi:hypothetical protein